MRARRARASPADRTRRAMARSATPRCRCVPGSSSRSATMQTICQAACVLLGRTVTDEPHRNPGQLSAPRRVLLLGASGFIGSAVLARFAAERVAVRAIARRAGSALDNVEWRSLDLTSLVEPTAWAPHLEGIDAVVNCAGG